MTQPYLGSKKRLFVLTMSVFIVMLGVGVISPILPQYARSFEVPFSVVGLTISVFGLARIIWEVPSGYLSDRFSRRLLMVVGMLVFSAAGTLAAYSQNIYHLTAARFLQGLGAASLTTSAMSYVVDISPQGQRGKYFAYYESAFSIGGVAGPVLGGFLAEAAGLRAPFLVLSILSLVGAIFTQYMLPNIQPLQKELGKTKSSLATLSLLLKGKRFLLANFVSFVAALLFHGAKVTAIPIYGRNQIGLSAGAIGLVMSSSSIVSLGSMLWGGATADKIGARRTIAYGFFAASLMLYLMSKSTSFYDMVLVAMGLGLVSSFLTPARAKLTVDASDPAHMGFSLGFNRLFLDIGIIIGPIMVGYLSDEVSLSSPFLAVASICILPGIFALLLRGAR